MSGAWRVSFRSPHPWKPTVEILARRIVHGEPTDEQYGMIAELHTARGRVVVIDFPDGGVEPDDVPHVQIDQDSPEVAAMRKLHERLGEEDSR